MNKKGFEMSMLGWIILALFFLAIFIIFMVILSGKGEGAIEYIKNLFKLRWG